MAGAGDGARSWFSACAGGSPWASPASCFLPGLLSTGWQEGETPAWALRAGAGGVAGTSSIFLRGGRKHLWGGVDKGQGHSQTLLVGHHAQLGEVGTQVPSKETLMRAPDQDKGVGRTHGPVLRKSPVIRSKQQAGTCTWRATRQGKRTDDRSAQQHSCHAEQKTLGSEAAPLGDLEVQEQGSTWLVRQWTGMSV